MDKYKLFYDVVNNFQPEDTIEDIVMDILSGLHTVRPDIFWELIDKLVAMGHPDPYSLEEISKGLEMVEEAVKNSADPPSPLTEESFQQYVDQLGGKHSIKPYSPIIPTHLYNMIKSEG